MHENKATVRTSCLSLRKTLPKKSVAMTDFLGLQQMKKAKVVFCYVSMGSEIGTTGLINELLKTKDVVVPYCIDKNGNMICVKITSLDDLALGMFGILEPIDHTPFDKEKIDVAILPGLAFDKKGYRIGYGKGYYDRFLADISPYKIGLTYKELYFEAIPHGKTDIRADLVIKK